MNKKKKDIAFLIQANLNVQPYRLSFQEADDLWKLADVDGNGVVNHEELKVFNLFFFFILLVVYL